MKKILKVLFYLSPMMFFVMLLVIAPQILFAQDTAAHDSTVATGGIGGIIDGYLGKASFWIVAILAILEVVARVIPSAASWAPITKVIQFLQKILDLIPNKTTAGQKFVASKDSIEPLK